MTKKKEVAKDLESWETGINPGDLCYYQGNFYRAIPEKGKKMKDEPCAYCAIRSANVDCYDIFCDNIVFIDEQGM